MSNFGSSVKSYTKGIYTFNGRATFCIACSDLRDYAPQPQGKATAF